VNTIKFEKGKVLAIAHRGLSGLEKENTNAAFVAAGNRSYYGIETDVRKTGDGCFVLNHDAHFKRVAGENLAVSESSMMLIQSVVLTDVDGTKNRQDLRPATLENYIDICKKYEKTSVLELKDGLSPEDIAQIVEIIRNREYLTHTVFISFEYENLTALRALLPQQPAQYLVFEITDEVIERAAADRLDLDVRYQKLTKAQVDAVHAAGLRLNCWTVNTKEDAERLRDWGVDFITTNILE